jgi:hypothetical protein
MTRCSLSARSLVRSLIEEFKREIGLKSPMLTGQSFLGIKVMNEELMLLKHTSPSKKSLKRS